MAVSFLNVLLTADGKQLSTQLKRSRRDVRRYSYLVRRDFRQLSRTIVRSTTVAAAGLTALSKTALTSADNIAKSARNAGLAVRDYQRLSHVFELSGSSSAALTKASAALSRQIFNLGRDSLEAVDNFSALNLELADLQGLSRGQQLNLVIKQLTGLTNETTKAAVAQALFGRAGKELGTLLETNAGEIQRLQDRYESLGGVIGNNALRNAERFNDELTTLTSVMRSQFTQGLVDAIGETREFDSTIRSLGELAGQVGRGFVNLTRFIVDHRKEIGIVIGAYATYRVGTSRLLRNIGKLIGAASGLGIVGLTAAITTFGTVLGGLVVAGGVLYTFIELLDNMDDHVNGVRESLGDLSSRSKDQLGKELDRVNKKIRELTLEFVNLDIHTSTVFGGVGFQTRRDLNDQINQLIEQRKILQAEFDKILTIKVVPEEINAVLVDLIQQARDEFNLSRRRIRLDLEPSDEDRRFQAFATQAREKVAQDALQATRRLEEELIRNREALIENSRAQRTDARFLQSRRNVRLDQQPSGLDRFNIRRDSVAEARRAEINEITQGLARDFNTSLRLAFRMGDFSDIGRVLVASITGALSDRLADQITEFFEAFLSKAFAGTGSSGGGFFASLFGFHEGGIVPGSRSREVPAVLQGGELVLTEAQQRMLGGSVTINQNITGDLTEQNRRFLRNNGDEVGRTVLGYMRENRAFG